MDKMGQDGFQVLLILRTLSKSMISRGLAHSFLDKMEQDGTRWLSSAYDPVNAVNPV